MKKIRKTIGSAAGYCLVHLLIFVIRILPGFFVLAMGRSTGWLCYVCLRRHRKSAFESLKTAFGDKTENSLRIIKNSFIYMGEVLFETLFYSVRKPDSKPLIEIKGIENMQRAAAAGKGVICTTAHMGAFPLIMYALHQHGYEAYNMLRPLRNRFLTDTAARLMSGCGVIPVFSYPRRTAIFESLRALKKNGLLAMVVDQNYGTGGVWVDFFGKLAAAPTGPVVLAQRSGAVILPVYIRRIGPGRHVIVIEEEFKLIEDEDNDKAILLNVAALTKKIQGWIEEEPEAWAWIHKRWKSRPDENDLMQKYKVQEGVPA